MVGSIWLPPCRCSSRRQHNKGRRKMFMGMLRERAFQLLPIMVIAMMSGGHRLFAQPVVQEITANPEAKQLRMIWRVTGGEFGGGEVGDGFGSCGDINSDGIEDFAVHYGTANEWHIYYGSKEPLDTTPVRIIKGLGVVPGYPVAGDFWGTGHKAVGFPKFKIVNANGHDYAYFQLYLYRTESGNLSDTASLLLDCQKMTPPNIIYPQQIIAADLDNDGAEELILFTQGVGRDGGYLMGTHPEVWIYRGGANFQVDTPTVILRSIDENAGDVWYKLIVGHLNDDPYMDLATHFEHADGTYKMSVWLGSSHSPWDWNMPDRTVQFGDPYLTALDCNGDGVLDFAIPGPTASVSLYLSSNGKTVIDRPFTLDDADIVYHATDYLTPLRLGYLNDSSKRYEMLGMLENGITYGFGGGRPGPDGEYDVTSGGLTFKARPVGDVTGDGWGDLMDGNYADNFDAGYAEIFAGGPYIPRDPSSGVEEIAIAGRSNGISTWPNPLRDELHIAWRGDLPHMPTRFIVHDMLGTTIAEGTVDSWRGEALWHCGDIPSGTYLLSIFDHDGQLLATTHLIREGATR